MIKIDKASCLCVDTRYEERKHDIADMSHRIQALGGDWETFKAITNSIPLGVPEDCAYIIENEGDRQDIPADQIKDLERWGYGRDGYKHHHWNAFQCHKAMIQRAIDEKRENLLLLEDDAYFTDRFEEVWEKVTEHIMPGDCDILYLGWWISDENDKFNRIIEQNWNEQGIIQIDKVRQLGGLHGALIDKSMFNFLMKLPATNPIDWQLNAYHSRINSKYILPKIIHTRTTYSLCEGSVITRNEL